MDNIDNIKFYSYPEYMYFNKLLKALWGFLWSTVKKIIRANPRVRKMKEQSFLKKLK